MIAFYRNSLIKCAEYSTALFGDPIAMSMLWRAPLPQYHQIRNESAFCSSFSAKFISPQLL